MRGQGIGAILIPCPLTGRCPKEITMAKAYREVSEVLATPHTVFVANTFKLIDAFGVEHVPAAHDKAADGFLRTMRRERTKLRSGKGTPEQRKLWAYWRATAAIQARAALAVSRQMRRG